MSINLIRLKRVISPVKMTRKIIALLILLAVPEAVFCWGPTGHRVVGSIAEEYLTRRARARLARILDGQSLAISATWMDEVRSDSSYDHMSDWHWVTIPDGMTYEQTEKNPAGDILSTLERVITALKADNLSPQEQREHVLILIHLVGDLHMPLHVGNGKDRGGNDTRVSWFGAPSNLHRVWDGDMIDHTRLSYTELAASLKRPTAAQATLWQQSGVLAWTMENMSYRESIYRIGKGALGYDYSYYNMPAVRTRLLQAGIRLAGILNDIFGN